MSIFSKADAGLNLITQLMQVNLENSDELLHFWRRTVALHYVLHTEDAVEPSLIVETEKNYDLTDMAFEWHDVKEDAEKLGMKNGEDFLLPIFQEACRHCVAYITSVYETDTWPIETLERIRAINSHARPSPLPEEYVLPPWSSYTEYQSKKYDFYGYGYDVPLDRFTHIETVYNFVPICILIRTFERTLTQLWEREATLLRCPECRNIFLSSHKKREYCSLRCGQRVNQRRQRAKKTDTVTNLICNAMVQ